MLLNELSSREPVGCALNKCDLKAQVGYEVIGCVKL